MFDDPRSSDDTRGRSSDERERGAIDPRDAFVESRTPSIVGSFRVVLSRDLRDHDGRPLDANRGDLRHLREQGLVRTAQVDGHRDVAVVLTERGRELLESHRRGDDGRDACGRGGESKAQQTFYADLKKPREVEHDMQI